MPSPKRSGTTRVLVQIPDAVHTKADTRRRREQTTWGRVVAELLRRWGSGDDAALTSPVRKPKFVVAPSGPGTERAQYLAWSERWDREHPEQAAKAAEKVDIKKLKRYRSAAELFAAGAARDGKVVSAKALAEPNDAQRRAVVDVPETSTARLARDS